LYVSVRATNLWSGQQAVDIAESLTETDRAGSLGFRFKCENLLAAKALQQPIFGWGAWGRSKAYFFEGTPWQTPAPTDGLWIIILGTKGFVGLTLFFLAMSLPVIRFGWRFPPGQWGDPRLATCSLVAVLLPLYIFDCLMNAFPNMIYVTLAGGLMGIEPSQFRALARARRGSARQHVPNGLAKVAPVAAMDADRMVSASIAQQIKLAASYHNLGRSAKKDGRFEDAESAWRQALEILSEMIETTPNATEPRRLWCDCLNDLAWLRANHPDPERRDAEAAVALAQRIVEACPDAEAYWNTLGAAYYRAGDNDLSVAALDRSMALGGGTAFDDVFLAMAHARQGDLEKARVEFDRAIANANHDYPGHPELARLCDEAQSILSEANSIA
jgi:Flp pilus assembly protein TadD